MELEECYEIIGGDYYNVIRRLKKEERIEKYMRLFVKDTSYDNFIEYFQKEDFKEAFRMIHSLKGICINLSFDKLGQVAGEITELLRNDDANTNLVKELIPRLKSEYSKTVSGIMAYMNEK
ncbi:MAG: Hpt domain-containing protein [Agathobacter sp.]|nr:Hpt domain-containing protein [Agathobacter sp.]